MITPDDTMPNDKEIKKIKDDIINVESSINQIRYSTMFSEDNINHLIRDVGSLKRTMTMVIKDIEEIKNLIANNQAFTPTTSAKEVLYLHKSSSSKASDDDTENSSVRSTRLESEIGKTTTKPKVTV